MCKKLVEIASEIVQTQAALTPMSAPDIALSLRQVFSTLQELQRAESGETALPGGEAVSEEKPELTPEDSIQNDKVICLECGAEMRQLTKMHLTSHGLNPKEYKKKYGFTLRTPLAAKSVTKERKRAAKKRGLPENLKKYMAAKRQQANVQAAPKPTAAKTKGPETSRAERVRKRFSPKTAQE